MFLQLVFSFVANAESDPSWRSEAKRLRNLSAQTAGLGTRSLEAPVNTERDVTAVEGGTLFTYSPQADVTDVFVFRALRPLIEWWYARKLRRFVQVLKQVLEAADAGRGAAP